MTCMRAFAALLILGLLLALGACSATSGGSAAVSAVVADTQQACVTISPALQAAASSSNAQVAAIAGYANAVCGPLAAGAVPPTVNASTPTWLGSLGGMISALLPIAVKLL